MPRRRPMPPTSLPLHRRAMSKSSTKTDGFPLSPRILAVLFGLHMHTGLSWRGDTWSGCSAALWSTISPTKTKFSVGYSSMNISIAGLSFTIEHTANRGAIHTVNTAPAHWKPGTYFLWMPMRCCCLATDGHYQASGDVQAAAVTGHWNWPPYSSPPWRNHDCPLAKMESSQCYDLWPEGFDSKWNSPTRHRCFGCLADTRNTNFKSSLGRDYLYACV